ncbi:MAG: hypothetical protein H0W23_01610 [Chloroflexia bacterium]|nr:hypothetical protein [Chloroflexia bacterium]
MTTSPDLHEPRPDVPGRFNRRTLVTGAATTGLAGVAGAGILRIAQAQVDPAVPDATSGATPDASLDETTAAGTPGATSDNERDFATAALARVDDVIASVETDRAAAGSGIDVTEIDILIARAGVHRDLAQTAIDAGDNAEAVRQAFVAVGSARAARGLIETGLDHPGLPSDEARAGRALTRVHAGIVAVTEESASATDPNVEFFVSHAQTLYTNAYELNEAGAFAQALGTGRVAGELARIAMILTPHISQIGVGRGGRGGGVFGGMRRGSAHGRAGMPGGPGGPGPDGIFGGEMEDGFDDGADLGATPETVPAPDFSPPATAV